MRASDSFTLYQAPLPRITHHANIVLCTLSLCFFPISASFLILSFSPSRAAFHEPPSFVYPTDDSVINAIERVAMLVSSDIAASGDLDEQRVMAGPLVRKPFPISRLEGLAGCAPGLATEFLPYKGSHAAYSAALESTHVNQVQQRHVVAVVQASGSGKTRLAYADGQDARVVVVARVWMQKRARKEYDVVKKEKKEVVDFDDF